MRVNADSLLIRAAATSTSGTLNDLTTDLIMANNNNNNNRGHLIMGPHCLISEEEVAAAIKGLKIGKAAGPTSVMSEMMKAAGGFGSRWMTDLINNIVKKGYIPDDWRKSILVPVYKGKGDPLVCGSYRAIRLLEQPRNVLERVLEKRIRCQVSIDNMQFGFMPGKGTTDAIFIMREVQEKHKAKKKTLY